MSALSERIYSKPEPDVEVSIRKSDLEDLLEAYASKYNIQATVFIKKYPGHCLEIFMDLYSSKDSRPGHFLRLTPRPDYIAIITATNAIDVENRILTR